MWFARRVLITYLGLTLVAARLADMRPSSVVTQGFLSERIWAWRTTAIAPLTSSERPTPTGAGRSRTA
jgi:hypothetical protein